MNKFFECEGCINAKLDPFQCQTCKKGSNWEGEDTSEELTFAEFKDLISVESQ